jgi:hypothetical protein
LVPGPKNPFHDWPIQIETPSLYAWYTEPGVFVSQLVVDHATGKDAESITRLIDRVLTARQDDLTPLGGLLVIHDWRAMRSYEQEARAIMMQRVRTHKRGIFRDMVVAVHVNPILRMAIEAANTFLVLATGRNVHAVNAVAPTLIKYGVKKPVERARFPGSEPSLVPPHPRPRGSAG